MPEALLPYLIGDVVVGVVGTALLFAFSKKKPIYNIFVFAGMAVLFAVLFYMQYKVIVNN